MSDTERTAAFMTPEMMSKAAPKVVPAQGMSLQEPPAEVGRAQVAHMAAVRGELQAQLHERDLQPLVSELQRLQASLERLDFELLKPKGWLARTTGKGRSDGAEFAHRFEEASQAAQSLARQAAAVQKIHTTQVAATERLQVELHVECAAIDQTVEQNARWLQGMRKQLQLRHSTATDPAEQAQVKEDAAQCELLVTRLKALRALSMAGQKTLQEGKGALVQRLALLQTLEQAQARTQKAWSERLGGTAAAAARGDTVGIDGPLELHGQLRKQLGATMAECALVQRHEATLALEIAALAQALDDAA